MEFAIEPVLRVVTNLLQVVLLVRLARLHLLKRYFYFSLLIGAYLITDWVLFAFDPTTSIYATAWAIASPLLWFAQILAAIEVFQLVCEEYPKLGKFAHYLLLAVLALAIVTAIVICIGVGIPPVWHFWVEFAVTISRGMYTGIAAFLLLQAIFFSFAGRKLPPNLEMHRWTLTIFCAALALSGFITQNTPKSVAILTNHTILIIGAICLVVWITRFSTVGETITRARSMSDEEIDAAKTKFAKMTKEVSRTSLRSMFFGNRR